MNTSRLFAGASLHSSLSASGNGKAARMRKNAAVPKVWSRKETGGSKEDENTARSWTHQRPSLLIKPGIKRQKKSKTEGTRGNGRNKHQVLLNYKLYCFNIGGVQTQTVQETTFLVFPIFRGWDHDLYKAFVI